MESTQAELDELEALLDELARLCDEAGDDVAPMVSEADGFLTALVLLPETISPEEWLDAFAPSARTRLTAASFDRLAARLIERKAVIASQLLQGRHAFSPIYDMDGRHDEILWEIWIEGFDRAVQLRHSAWVALFESNDAILAEAVENLFVLVGISRGVRLDPGEHEKVVTEAPDLIPVLAEILYRRQRGLALTPETSARKTQEPIGTPKIGRNEPCPCGSGKKFKRCCGG